MQRSVAADPFATPSDDDVPSGLDEADLQISRAELDELVYEAIETCPESQMAVGKKAGAPPNWVRDSIGLSFFRNTHRKSESYLSHDQIETIRQQLKQNLQLCVQAYCIERQLKGMAMQEEDDFFWQRQLFHQIREYEKGVKKHGKTLFNVDGIQHIPFLLDYRFDSTTDEAKEFIANYSAHATKIKRDLFVEKNVALHSMQRSLNAKLSATLVRPVKGVTFAALPRDVCRALSVFENNFEPSLSPFIISIKRITAFTTEEDDLMYRGLLKFGFSDLSSVRAHFLPTYTCNQIKARFKNIKHRGKSGSIIRELYLQPFRGLRVIEKELLVMGVKHLGLAFRAIAQQLLPQYPDALIKFAWDELVAIGQISTPWDEIDYIATDDNAAFGGWLHSMRNCQSIKPLGTVQP
eukprot:jgi/Hompol1/2406/HPOL_002908-RA